MTYFSDFAPTEFMDVDYITNKIETLTSLMVEFKNNGSVNLSSRHDQSLFLFNSNKFFIAIDDAINYFSLVNENIKPKQQVDA